MEERENYTEHFWRWVEERGKLYRTFLEMGGGEGKTTEHFWRWVEDKIKITEHY